MKCTVHIGHETSFDIRREMANAIAEGARHGDQLVLSSPTDWFFKQGMRRHCNEHKWEWGGTWTDNGIPATCFGMCGSTVYMSLNALPAFFSGEHAVHTVHITEDYLLEPFESDVYNLFYIPSYRERLYDVHFYVGNRYVSNPTTGFIGNYADSADEYEYVYSQQPAFKAGNCTIDGDVSICQACKHRCDNNESALEMLFECRSARHMENSRCVKMPNHEYSCLDDMYTKTACLWRVGKELKLRVSEECPYYAEHLLSFLSDGTANSK